MALTLHQHSLTPRTFTLVLLIMEMLCVSWFVCAIELDGSVPPPPTTTTTTTTPTPTPTITTIPWEGPHVRESIPGHIDVWWSPPNGFTENDVLHYVLYTCVEHACNNFDPTAEVDSESESKWLIRFTSLSRNAEIDLPIDHECFIRVEARDHNQQLHRSAVSSFYTSPIPTSDMPSAIIKNEHTIILRAVNGKQESHFVDIFEFEFGEWRPRGFVDDSHAMSIEVKTPGLPVIIRTRSELDISSVTVVTTPIFSFTGDDIQVVELTADVSTWTLETAYSQQQQQQQQQQHTNNRSRSFNSGNDEDTKRQNTGGMGPSWLRWLSVAMEVSRHGIRRSPLAFDPTHELNLESQASNPDELGSAFSFVHFPLSSSVLPRSSSISSLLYAQLCVTVVNLPEPGDINIYEMSEAWLPSTLTYNSQPKEIARGDLLLGTTHLTNPRLCINLGNAFPRANDLLKRWVGLDNSALSYGFVISSDGYVVLSSSRGASPPVLRLAFPPEYPPILERTSLPYDWNRILNDGAHSSSIECLAVCHHNTFSCTSAWGSPSQRFVFANPLFQASSDVRVEQATIIVKGKWDAGRWLIRLGNAFIAERSMHSSVSNHTTSVTVFSSTYTETERCSAGCKQAWFTSPLYARAVGGIPSYPYNSPDLPVSLSFVPEHGSTNQLCVIDVELVLYYTRPDLQDGSSSTSDGASTGQSTDEADGESSMGTLCNRNSPKYCDVSVITATVTERLKQRIAVEVPYFSTTNLFLGVIRVPQETASNIDPPSSISISSPRLSSLRNTPGIESAVITIELTVQKQLKNYVNGNVEICFAIGSITPTVLQSLCLGSARVSGDTVEWSCVGNLEKQQITSFSNVGNLVCATTMRPSGTLAAIRRLIAVSESPTDAQHRRDSGETEHLATHVQWAPLISTTLKVIGLVVVVSAFVFVTAVVLMRYCRLTARTSPTGSNSPGLTRSPLRQSSVRVSVDTSSATVPSLTQSTNALHRRPERVRRSGTHAITTHVDDDLPLLTVPRDNEPDV